MEHDLQCLVYDTFSKNRHAKTIHTSTGKIQLLKVIFVIKMQCKAFTLSKKKKLSYQFLWCSISIPAVHYNSMEPSESCVEMY